MKKFVFVFFLLSFMGVNNNAQNDSIKVHFICGTLIDKPFIITIDGLKVLNIKLSNLNIEWKYCHFKVKRIPNKESSLIVRTEKLFVLNGLLLPDYNCRVKLLSQIKEENILSIKYVPIIEAQKKYGKLGNHGAFEIQIKQ
jgi:hypothetical protein